MARESTPVITADDVEIVRRVLLDHALAAAGLGLSRQKVCRLASIRGSDLDNFTKTDRKGAYKTIRPDDRILIRLVRYIATDERLSERAIANEELRKNIERITAVYHSLEMFTPDDDHLFFHLRRMKATNEERCVAICRRLAGFYYGYRYSTTPNRIIKSHFEIEKFDPKRKVPNFLHHLRYEDKVPRFTRGQIVELGNSYAFLGFVSPSTYEYEGAKLMVISKEDFGYSDRLHGSFISYGGHSIHQVGFIQLVKTDEKYDPLKIGEFSFDEISKADPLFQLSAIRCDLTGDLDGNYLVAALISPIPS